MPEGAWRLEAVHLGCLLVVVPEANIDRKCRRTKRKSRTGSRFRHLTAVVTPSGPRRQVTVRGARGPPPSTSRVASSLSGSGPVVKEST